jgi:hypothetical protein
VTIELDSARAVFEVLALLRTNDERALAVRGSRYAEEMMALLNN